MDEYNDIKDMLKPRRDIRASENFRERVRKTLDNNRKPAAATPWILGGVSLGTVAAILIILLVPVGTSAREILKSALTTLAHTGNIAMTVEVRTLIRDNFSFISPEADFIPHDIRIIRSDSTTFWSVDKGGRAAEKNSEGVSMWIKEFNVGWHSDDPDLDVLGYLGIFTRPEKILEAELQLALSENVSDYSMKKKDGRIYLTVHSRAEGDFTNPYMLNKSIAESENIRQYVIDEHNFRLLSATVSIIKDSREIEVLKISEINYNPENLSLLRIPSSIRFIAADIVSVIDGIPGLDARETAAAMFSAFYTWDTDILDKLINPIVGNSYRSSYEGATLLSLGEPFMSGNNKDLIFVPYSVRLKDGSVKSMNLALIKTGSGGWVFSGGL